MYDVTNFSINAYWNACQYANKATVGHNAPVVVDYASFTVTCAWERI